MDSIAERILQLRGNSNIIMNKRYSFHKKISLEDGFSLYKFKHTSGNEGGKFVLSIPCEKEINHHIFFIPEDISGYMVKNVYYNKDIDRLIVDVRNKAKRRISYVWDYKDRETVFIPKSLELYKSSESGR